MEAEIKYQVEKLIEVLEVSRGSSKVMDMVVVCYELSRVVSSGLADILCMKFLHLRQFSMHIQKLRVDTNVPEKLKIEKQAAPR